AELLRLAVDGPPESDLAPALFERLTQMVEAGGNALVKAMIVFVNGDVVDLKALEEEDQAILQAMQRGLEDPTFLAELEQDVSHQAAAPLAALIYAATMGEREALETLAGLREAADTPTATATAEALIAIVEGERKADALTSGLPEAQAGLVRAVLSELAVLEAA
ncbi:MAG: hypothetical protein P3W87_008145, partial [Gammaproteobacteria bacterium]|nr:hypothetical protein [Gammaproteobacteria bacterium]